MNSPAHLHSPSQLEARESPEHGVEGARVWEPQGWRTLERIWRGHGQDLMSAVVDSIFKISLESVFILYLKLVGLFLKRFPKETR